MTLGKKIGLCFGATFAAAAILGGTALVLVSETTSDLATAARDTAHCIELIGELKSGVQTLRLANRGVLLYSQVNGGKNADTYRQAFGKAVSDLTGTVTELRKVADSAGTNQQLGDVSLGIDQYRQAVADVRVILDRGALDEAVKVNQERTVPIGKNLTKAAENLLAAQRKLNEVAEARANALRLTSRIAVALLLSVLAGVAVLAGLAVRRATRTLHGLAHDLSVSSREIHAASEQVSRASEGLAGIASTQAAANEETSASAQQIAAAARHNADGARETVSITAEAQKIAAGVTIAVHAMAESVEQTVSSSDQIARVVRTIEEIAFQTNILA
jgi:methyl-accepting chemotaxis protein